jgi:hypothetical protein
MDFDVKNTAKERGAFTPDPIAMVWAGSLEIFGPLGINRTALLIVQRIFNDILLHKYFQVFLHGTIIRTIVFLLS